MDTNFWTVSSGGKVKDVEAAKAVMARYISPLDYHLVTEEGHVDISGYDHPTLIPRPAGWNEDRDDTCDLWDEWGDAGLSMMLLELAPLLETDLIVEVVSAEGLRSVAAFCWTVAPGATEVCGGGLPTSTGERRRVVFTADESARMGWPEHPDRDLDEEAEAG